MPVLDPQDTQKQFILQKKESEKAVWKSQKRIAQQ